jgi:predicted RNA-binding protein with PIN domain
MKTTTNLTPLRSQLINIMDTEREEKRAAIACIIDYHKQHGADDNKLFNIVLNLWEATTDTVINELETIVNALHIELLNPLKRK